LSTYSKGCKTSVRQKFDNTDLHYSAKENYSKHKSKPEVAGFEYKINTARHDNSNIVNREDHNLYKEKNNKNAQVSNQPLVMQSKFKDANKDKKLRKCTEESKRVDTLQSENNEGQVQKLPQLSTELHFTQGAQRCETFETDYSALNLSPRSKRMMKLKRLIKKSFANTGKAPDSTSDFYRIGKVLGRGAFGKVSLTVHRLTQEMVAIKSIDKEFLTDENSRIKVMKEVKILKRIRHKSIIQLYDTFETNKHIIFVMELCSGGDLLNYVRMRRKLTEDYAKTIFKQIMDALHYCHRQNILHRDVKLDNIILDSEGNIKIGDFGVSKIVDPTQKMYDQCGTPAYIAPEILRDRGYRGFGIDVWSSGVVLYAMLYGTVPFRAQNMVELNEMIIKAKYTLKPDISEEARDLLKKILETDPKKRLKIPEILAHPWFNDLETELEMFTEQEKEKIKEEFSYNDIRKNNKVVETDAS